MFDEYQDCNRIQEMIVQKIAGNAVYFMFGDLKQSIYGFRQAEPGLFFGRKPCRRDSRLNQQNCQIWIRGSDYAPCTTPLHQMVGNY